MERGSGGGHAVFGTHDDATLAQFSAVMERARAGALMADGHVGFVMPIGGVAAYENAVSVSGVGYDIGCGNLAVRFDASASDFDVGAALDCVEREIVFGVGGAVQAGADARDHGVFGMDEWDAYPAVIREDMRKLARGQLGTVGAGNHYVDFFSDESGRLWLGLHFGSRGLGHKTASGFLNLAAGRGWDGRPAEKETVLSLSSSLGQAYFRAMTLAGAYARAGRELVRDRIAAVLGLSVAEEVHNHHNFAWRERHAGRDLVVVRKGATPAWPGQRGFVGGSMGDISVIVEGVDCDLSRAALYSTVHGAGRVMSRTRAAGKFAGHGRNRRLVSPGLVTKRMLEDGLSRFGVELRGGGLDEAPQAYRPLGQVIAAQGPTVRVIHTLRPLGVVMAGPEVSDPYRH